MSLIQPGPKHPRVSLLVCLLRNGALCAVSAAVISVSGCGAPPRPAAPPPTVPTTPPPTAAGHQIPLTLARGPYGAGCVVVDVSAGGGSPVPVQLDTGGPGLLMAADAIGPQAQPTGRTHQVGFVHSPVFTTSLVSAPVSVGSGPSAVTTPGSIVIESLPDPGPLAAGLSRCGPIRGILGIGMGGPDPRVAPIESPLLQLGPGLSDGYSLALTERAGTLTLGAPTASPSSVSLPLPAANGTYPDGHRAYQRDVTLCWTIGTTHGCGPTNLDSGGYSHLIRPDFLPTLTRRGILIPASTPVSITTPDGRDLESFTTTTMRLPDTAVQTAPLFGSTQANTGLRFFQANTVGFDAISGTVIITPQLR